MEKMNDSVKQDIIYVLNQALQRIKRKDFTTLKDLSNQTIHNASIFQDPDSVSIAVIMYALSKLADRSMEPAYIKKIKSLIERCLRHLTKEDVESHRVCIKSMFRIISAYDTKFKLYVEEVIEKAQVKKGSKLYEHGISVAKAAEILGIGQWELMSYVGKTSIHDQFTGKVDVKRRIAFARNLFS
ncbi:hypothetical protein ACFL96_11110 [Thermoproteota archaeon]